MKRFFLFALILLGSLSLSAQEQFSKYETREYISQGDTLPYRILYPKGFNEKKSYPVVLFMHGAGDRGTNNWHQLRLGGELFASEEAQKDYPAIVIYPQCPADEMWTHRTKWEVPNVGWCFDFPLGVKPPRGSEMVMELMDSLLSKPYTDKDRVYIMGISMGAISTLEYLYRFPERYAAAVVICGGNDSKYAQSYSHIPIWFFHGDRDDVVPPKYSSTLYVITKDGNPETRYTNFPDKRHDIYFETLEHPELLEWTFKQRRKNR